MGMPSQCQASLKKPAKDVTTQNGKQVNPKRKPKATDGKEVLRIVTHDMIRDLIVPAVEPNMYPAVMEKSEYDRLKNQAKIITKRERFRMMEESEKNRNRLIQDCMTRKDQIDKWERQREKGSKLRDLEVDATRRAKHLLMRAFELRQEQEDEVKEANRLILGTKCHAIRDAQVAEKKLIQKELEEEERRLDQMMEQERLHSLQDEEIRKEKEHTKKQHFVKQILEQMRQNEIEKIMEAERIEEESRVLNEAAMQVQLDELEAVEKKKKLKEQTKQELLQINSQLHYFQELEREEARVADLKVQEFMRQKAEREAAREEELKMISMAKEREIARLRELQQRQQDVQAQMDDLNAQRTQDEVEREWRRKEQEEVRKKQQENEALKKARSQQVLDRRRMQALEIAREKREFERVIKVQQEAAERDRLDGLRRQSELEGHRTAILKQINEKERERIKQRQEQFQEGVAIKVEHEQRQRYIREAMHKKMANLRNHKVPEPYVREIEKQLKLRED